MYKTDVKLLKKITEDVISLDMTTKEITVKYNISKCLAGKLDNLNPGFKVKFNNIANVKFYNFIKNYFEEKGIVLDEVF